MDTETAAIIGHKDVLAFFDQSIENGRLTHGYLLTGPASVGKTTIIRTIAAKLLETDDCDRHSEWILVDGEHIVVNEEEKDSIPIDTIRELIRRSSLSIVGAPCRVVTVLSAERLNREATNCFLKLLEDPPPRTIFFLTATHANAVLPTLRSRLQRVRVRPVRSDVIRDALETRGVDKAQAAEIIQYAEGLPGRALRCVDDPELLVAMRVPFDRWRIFLHNPRILLTHLLIDVEDRVALRSSIATLHSVLHTESTVPASLRQRVYAASVRALDQLQTNTSPKLIFEHVVLSAT